MLKMATWTTYCRISYIKYRPRSSIRSRIALKAVMLSNGGTGWIVLNLHKCLSTPMSIRFRSVFITVPLQLNFIKDRQISSKISPEICIKSDWEDGLECPVGRSRHEGASLSINRCCDAWYGVREVQERRGGDKYFIWGRVWFQFCGARQSKGLTPWKQMTQGHGEFEIRWIYLNIFVDWVETLDVNTKGYCRHWSGQRWCVSKRCQRRKGINKHRGRSRTITVFEVQLHPRQALECEWRLKSFTMLKAAKWWFNGLSAPMLFFVIFSAPKYRSQMMSFDDSWMSSRR